MVDADNLDKKKLLGQCFLGGDERANEQPGRDVSVLLFSVNPQSEMFLDSKGIFNPIQQKLNICIRNQYQ